MRLSNNFAPEHTINKTSPFDVIYKTNEAQAIEIILKSMYGPNVDDYNWIGLSDKKFSDVETSLERFLNLKGKWLDKTIESYAKPQQILKNTNQNIPTYNDTVELPVRVLSGVAFFIFIAIFLFAGMDVILFTFKIVFSLLISPYSLCGLAYSVGLGLIGEAADGFKKGWFERLAVNYWAATLICAGLGELLLPAFFGMEPYFL